MSFDIKGSNINFWDLGKIQQGTIFCTGSGSINNTLSGTVVDAGSGLVTIPCASHGYAADSYVYIYGTTSYDGTYIIQSTATDTFDVKATYTAETFSGTEIVQPGIAPGVPFRVLETRLHLSAVGGTSEDFEIKISSTVSDIWNAVPASQDMNAVDDLIVDWSGKLKFFQAREPVIFTYNNTNSRVWSLVCNFTILAERNYRWR